jgi:prepilin-type N-terminal cleavage/methylation domain-containing protein
MVRTSRTGFSLIELLVVVAILGVLIGLFLGAVQKAREAANRIDCVNNLKQLGLAVHTYHDGQSALPPSRLGDEYATWCVLLLPYLEQGDLYGEWDLQKTYANQPASARTTSVKVYYCPSRRSPPQLSKDPNLPGAVTDYACSSGDRNSYGGYLDDPSANGAMVQAIDLKIQNGLLVNWQAVTTFQSLSDGLSNTLLLGEKCVLTSKIGASTPDAAAYEGIDPPRNVARCGGPGFPLASSSITAVEDERTFGGCHPRRCQFVLGDGHVIGLSTDIDPAILRLLVVRDDGEVIPAFE